MNVSCSGGEGNFLWGVVIPIAVVSAAWIVAITYVCFKPSLWPKLFGPTEKK